MSQTSQSSVWHHAGRVRLTRSDQPRWRVRDGTCRRGGIIVSKSERHPSTTSRAAVYSGRKSIPSCHTTADGRRIRCLGRAITAEKEKLGLTFACSSCSSGGKTPFPAASRMHISALRVSSSPNQRQNAPFPVWKRASDVALMQSFRISFFFSLDQRYPMA